ncbi:hypothetical protein EX895_004988 [Sporisorium graminicola]|uniref:Uncharacterized protein n=1 Tax=Sporisorium graminicola TaxID=280036 RepID=A0A4U7KPK4_9BASI|nr:hypothetical protein EX895_004988 [Sporisorium graminicola]TKY86163.1 hypothetical protein EX895_004988 [Sporisorium graminicola]
MSSTTPSPVLQLTLLPSEILHLIAQAYIDSLSADNNIASVLCTSNLLRDLFLPKLYASIHIHSLDQLSRFVHPDSGAHIHAPRYTLAALTINIPGVPGGGDGTSTAAGKKQSRDRLVLASQALQLCRNVQSVSLEFFSIRHSEILTSDDLRAHEARVFKEAVQGLGRVKRFRWVPPRRDANAIRGLSIVVVDQVVASLAQGLIGCTELQTLELWNMMLPEDGGAQLASALIYLSNNRAQRSSPRTLQLTLRSVTNLSPRTIADLALANPAIKVSIADGFVASIWGARVDKLAVEECMRDALAPDGSPSSSDGVGSSRRRSDTSSSSDDPSITTSRAATPEAWILQTLAKASENVCFAVLQGGIAGSEGYAD